MYETGSAYRVVADHVRSCVFLIAQGLNFDKEGRGYVLRKILRRALREGYILGLRKPFIYLLVDIVVNTFKEYYPYLKEKEEYIKNTIKNEEERFLNTIDKGIDLFNKEVKKNLNIFSSDVSFKLYDTYGFPLDLTKEMAKEKGIVVDEKGFDVLMDKQREIAKASWKGSGDIKLEGDFKELLGKENLFIGYESLGTNSKVMAILDEDFKSINILKKGSKAWLMLDKTPFYPEGGGQIGDRGELVDFAKVLDTKKFLGLNLSFVQAYNDININDELKAKVSSIRVEIQKHHSATHLLHFALREFLGNNISQAGSLVEANRLRFDFTYPKALSKEELSKIELMVNNSIFSALKTKIKYSNIVEAKKQGAIALFGEKYEDEVRVVSFGDESIELCGGCHVNNTLEIGMFIILKESGVSAGVRRIEAVCGKEAYNIFKRNKEILEDSMDLVKSKDLVKSIIKLKESLKEKEKQIRNLESSSKLDFKVSIINGVNVIIDELLFGDIKINIDEVKNKYSKLAIMLFSKKDGKLSIACACKGIDLDAVVWIKKVAPILGGGGGGRADFAQAGAKDYSKLAEAKEFSLKFLKENL